ncbi:hypothetical protein PtrSN002B_007448 [Pyrenophora tritici-repentis]|uniref:Uncharacterized protein n=2 Tax=Pyrenophora tritici-repentis TaxID=45151 RepID=A0A2W1DQZ1_9PLEO|nr:uncharacterized protein PTRG_08853 [Pyrenophora tritici-repentis Pt-1C-BFP]KAA8627428.1 hypothetical protein PtrV1_03108 [Pyrenophora tritici-repentis]EDU41904.1 hypothetical protein PTRG_08853 [Pyrenophora tritici-repentis Pt-1C-BFP]KAF7442538.1 hypothetical protein A1F99_134070 [Pyrenophora tritici-repentis]KAF7579086.1 hypothetical protein PtrM4_033260 [Pyrenophora tritici-repentis]KAG9378012.1 hypothetical protein A1F94_011128 [Pyrenophora tritici-repentis]
MRIEGTERYKQALVKFQRGRLITAPMVKEPGYYELIVDTERLQNDDAPEQPCFQVFVPIGFMLSFQDFFELHFNLAGFCWREWLVPFDKLVTCAKIYPREACGVWLICVPIGRYRTEN